MASINSGEIMNKQIEEIFVLEEKCNRDDLRHLQCDSFVRMVGTKEPAGKVSINVRGIRQNYRDPLIYYSNRAKRASNHQRQMLRITIQRTPNIHTIAFQYAVV